MEVEGTSEGARGVEGGGGGREGWVWGGKEGRERCGAGTRSPRRSASSTPRVQSARKKQTKAGRAGKGGESSFLQLSLRVLPSESRQNGLVGLLSKQNQCLSQIVTSLRPFTAHSVRFGLNHHRAPAIHELVPAVPDFHLNKNALLQSTLRPTMTNPYPAVRIPSTTSASLRSPRLTPCLLT